jgi:hypothetical protein
VVRQKEEVAYGKLDRKARIGIADASNKAEGNYEGSLRQQKRERTTAIAKALAEGLIQEVQGSFEVVGGEEAESKLQELGIDPKALKEFDNEVYDSAEQLREYGKERLELEA